MLIISLIRHILDCINNFDIGRGHVCLVSYPHAINLVVPVITMFLSGVCFHYWKTFLFKIYMTCKYINNVMEYSLCIVFPGKWSLSWQIDGILIYYQFSLAGLPKGTQCSLHCLFFETLRVGRVPKFNAMLCLPREIL